MFYTKKVFSADWVNNIHKIAKEYKVITGDSYKVTTSGQHSFEENYQMKFIPLQKYDDVKRQLTKVAFEANKERYGFNVWFETDTVQYTIYDSNQQAEYPWHVDSLWFGKPSVQKLTVVVGLTDSSEYEGGELEFLNRKTLQYKLTAGEVVVFPSIAHHRVKPVTKGIRHTLVAWYSGPRWM